MLKKADLVHVSVREALLYMTDPLDYESRHLNYQSPWSQGRERVFALLLALGAKNGILNKITIQCDLGQVIKLYQISFLIL